MNNTPISMEVLPQCIDEFASTVPEYGELFKKFVLNANEAYLQKNDINLGISMRLCAEHLCKTYLLRYNIPDNMELAKMIELLPSSGLIDQRLCTLLDAMRKAGNSAAHTTYESYLDLYKIYEEFYKNIDEYINIAYTFNTVEELPTIIDQSQSRRDPNPARFVDYAESVIKMYTIRAFCFYIWLIPNAIGIFLLLKSLFSSFKYGFRFREPILESLIMSVVFSLVTFWMFKFKKAYSPAASYRNDQVKFNYGVKYVNDWIFAGNKLTIDFGYSWEDLHKYH